MPLELRIDERRILHRADENIYGQFIEHFGQLIYGSIFEPRHPAADADGFRTDVLDALKKLRIPVMRWPGGCFASAYHWKDGIGAAREPAYDKAWCVEESNQFGTDEFMLLCKKIGCAPYLCTNAGTGTPEEMADWVEYCNAPRLGRWAKRRIQNGHKAPYGVKYWSIGNENYTGGEIGSKSAGEWGRYVRECAKMMLRVDPTIQLLAPGIPADVDWNLDLLRNAGNVIRYISIHNYFDPAWESGILSDYVHSLQAPAQFEAQIGAVQGLLRALGLDDKVKIAFDEWNLRGWYHPGIVDFSRLSPDHEWAAAQRLKNEDNAQYTMADAVFNAAFLNLCLRHGDIVTMANFSPTVCGRGLLGVNEDGVVLRPTYFVFDLYRNRMGSRVVSSYLSGEKHIDAAGVPVPAIDAAAALDEEGRLTIGLINRHPDEAIDVRIETAHAYERIECRTVNGAEKDSFNDFDRPDSVKIRRALLSPEKAISLEPHSVNVLVLE